MPELEDVEYSRAEAIQAVRGYYTFLSNMYLDSSRIAEPPGEDGWPFITPQRFQAFGKSPEVVALLRHLPYITGVPPNAWGDRPHAGPAIHFHDYTREPGNRLNDSLSEKEGRGLRLVTEDGLQGQVPPHVVGLTSGGAEGSFLLDTKLGIVHWTDCPTEIQYKITLSKKGIYPTQETESHTREGLRVSNDDVNTMVRTGNDQQILQDRTRGVDLQGTQESQVTTAEQDDLGGEVSSSETSEAVEEQDPDIIEQILDDAYAGDWCPEIEQDWRGDSGKWTIADFFEVLKLHFLTLDWVPISDNRVMDVWSAAQHGRSRMISEVQGIWREHGWPAAEAHGNFDKVACLAHIRQFLCEKYPDVGKILDLYP